MIFAPMPALQLYIYIYKIFPFMQTLHCVRALPLPRTTIKYYIKATYVSTYTCFSSKRGCCRLSANRKTTESFRITFGKRKYLLAGGFVAETRRIRENLGRQDDPNHANEGAEHGWPSGMASTLLTGREDFCSRGTFISHVQLRGPSPPSPSSRQASGAVPEVTSGRSAGLKVLWRSPFHFPEKPPFSSSSSAPALAHNRHEERHLRRIRRQGDATAHPWEGWRAPSTSFTTKPVPLSPAQKPSELGARPGKASPIGDNQHQQDRDKPRAAPAACPESPLPGGAFLALPPR